MTATQPHDDGLTRRGVMRRAGIGATTAVGIGASASRLDAGPVGSASAVAPLVAAGVLGAGVGAAAVVAYGRFIGGPDDEEVADAIDWQTHVNEFTRAQEDEILISETLASLQRDVQLVENKAREQAIFDLAEAAADGLSEEDSKEAAEDAILDAYSTVEQSIVTSYATRAIRLHTLAKRFVDLNDTEYFYDVTEIYGVSEDNTEHTTSNNNLWPNHVVDGDSGSFDWGFQDYQLLDGTTESIPHYTTDSDDIRLILSLDPDLYESHSDQERVMDIRLEAPDPDDYETTDDTDLSGDATVLDSEPWARALRDLYEGYNGLLDEVQAMADAYYQPASDGEFDFPSMVGPDHLANTAENAEDFEEAALALRAMGYKLADQASILEFDIDGEMVEAEGRLARTTSSPDPLPAGIQIDPDSEPGSIYIAYNNRDEDGELIGGEIAELSDPFVIAEADGGEVTFESRELAESDHNLSAEEISEIFEENRQADDDAREVVHEIAVGGAGGILGFDDGIPTIGVIAGGAALLALLFGNN